MIVYNCTLYSVQLYTINKHIRDYFEHADIKRITHNEIIEFRKHLIEKKLSNKSVNNLLATLRFRGNLLTLPQGFSFITSSFIAFSNNWLKVAKRLFTDLLLNFFSIRCFLNSMISG